MGATKEDKFISRLNWTEDVLTFANSGRKIYQKTEGIAVN